MTSTMMTWSNPNHCPPFSNHHDLAGRARYTDNENHPWRHGMTEISRLIPSDRSYKNEFERDTGPERQSCQAREKFKDQTSEHVTQVPHGEHYYFSNRSDEENNVISNRHSQRKDFTHAGNSIQPSFIEQDSIESFLEYARYLDNVNPICPPEAIDTFEKLITLLGM